MCKKIAIVVRDRQDEALRMSAGITLMDDIVEIFFIDRILDGDNEKVEMNLEIVAEMEIPLYSNRRENSDMNFIETDEIRAKLLDYDHIIAY